eukprot:UN23477
MRDVPAEDNNTLWTSVVGCFIFTTITCYFMQNTYNELATTSDEFFINSQEANTVMVSHIPRASLRNGTLKQIFNNLFYDVDKVSLTEQVEVLSQLNKKLTNCQQNLDYYREHYMETGDRPRVRTNWCGKMVDAISYYEEQKMTIDVAMRKELKAKRPKNQVAFITFKSVASACI